MSLQSEKNHCPATAADEAVIRQVFRRYDIRGIFPTEVSEKLAVRIGLGVGTAVLSTTKENVTTTAVGDGRIVVGRDNRPSSKALQDALTTGILSSGIGVYDVGVGTSDFVSLSGSRLKARLSIIVTASHLSIQHNGFKFMYPAGNGLINEDLNRIKDEVLRGSTAVPPLLTTHNVTKQGIEDVHDELLEQYLKTLEQHYRMNRSGTLEDVSVVVDTADGPATLTIPPLLERLGAERVIPAHCDMAKAFRRESDPTPRNTDYIPKIVLNEKADLAIATDIDADRLAAFDSEGKWIDGDSLFCLFGMDESLASSKDTVIASIDTSQALNEVCKAKIVFTRIGDPFVMSAAIKHGASLAGEPNGHYCDPTLVPYNSATFFGAVLAGMCGSGRFKEYSSRIPRVFRTHHTIKIPSGKEPVVTDLGNRIIGSDSKKILLSTIDGVKFATDAFRKTQVLVRASGTESLIRVTVQSTKSLEDAQAVLEKTTTDIHGLLSLN